MENSEQTQTKTVHTERTAAVVDTHPKAAYQTKKAIFRTYQVIWYLLGLIEVLLAFRIFFKMLAANPYSGFVNMIYSITDPLALPFYGIFRITVTQGSVFEWSTIVAGIVYFLIAYGIIQLLQIMKPTNPIEVEETVDSQ